jgi:hypothetical protein
MDDDTHSSLQRLAKALLPAGIEHDIEEQSKHWMVACTTCGTEQSVWARGGIRWKAAGEPRVRGQCAKCGQARWHRIYWKA